MTQSYQVFYLPRTEKFFRSCPPKLATRIIERVEQIAVNPFITDHNLTKLKEPLEGYRLRVGDFQVIYLLDTSSHRLIVAKIDHRSAVYQ